MADSANWALGFAARAQNHAVVRVFHYWLLFAVFFFKLVGAKLAVIYAFSATDALFIINYGIPRNFASGNSFVCFFCHDVFPSGLLFTSFCGLKLAH